MRKSIAVAACLILLSGCGGMVQTGSTLIMREAYLAGDYKKCVTYATQAQGYGTRTPEVESDIALHKAMCIERQTSPAEAEGLYKRIVDSYPGTEGAARAKTRLDNAK